MLDSIFDFIKDAPISKILMLAGFVFLVFAIVEQFGIVKIAAAQRRLALKLGLSMFTAGVIGQIVPRLFSQMPPSSVTPDLQPPKDPSRNTATAESPEPEQPKPVADNLAAGTAGEPPKDDINDTMGTAKVIQIGSVTFVKHSSNDEHRYFKFSTDDNPPKRTLVLLRMNHSNSLFSSSLQVEMFDSKANPICSKNNKKTSEVRIECIVSTNKNSTYFIVVSQSDFLGNPAEYELHIRNYTGT